MVYSQSISNLNVTIVANILYNQFYLLQIIYLNQCGDKILQEYAFKFLFATLCHKDIQQYDRPGANVVSLKPGGYFEKNNFKEQSLKNFILSGVQKRLEPNFLKNIGFQNFYLINIIILEQLDQKVKEFIQKLQIEINQKKIIIKKKITFKKMLKQRNKKQFFLLEFGKQNQTQLIMTTIFLLPTSILLISTIISLFYFQQISLGMIDDFAENLYQDQISNSKILNTVVVQQINGQVQKIAWHFNMMNQFYGKLLLNSVQKNNNFIATVQNQQLTYDGKGNAEVLKIFNKNQLLTSTWIQPNYGNLQQLNETSLQQIFQTSHVDFIWKSIKYDDNIENFRWMQIQTMYYGFVSDGMLFGMGSKGNYKSYIIPPGCPYNDQPYLFDLRCRFYYQPTIKNISISVFPPALNINYGTYYFATNICQRIKKYSSQNADSENTVYAILCSTLNLKSISTYFINFSKNSVYQRLLDPRQLSLVYDSNMQIKSVTQIQDIETKYLQDQFQAQNYLGEINAHSKFVLQETDTINLSNPYSSSQSTFEYNRNGTECFVILNSVIMIDKVPKQETLKTVNPAKKYQIKNIYLFMDVLSKKTMLVYAQNLQDTIIFYNKIFLYISWGLVLIMLFVLVIYSILIGFSIFQPVIHLKNILDQIKVQNQKEKLKQPLSALQQYAFHFLFLFTRKSNSKELAK
ncbi:transmembrane protein, putative (macronuclear) [Tetrahymena thermophila SB210]|uniref:Transmembrane protein, putative n=1 Tax=Tetrahymena thermophila (strain SB210) TaxID=312017 RepID=I7LU63_TETTS|nr:transmembrane protein, putative [Tetrahymena thermophila SB210]EAR89971.2 transmembrane protein, putative [Tetrahymena thermophila SB210]|eukprot:XP_001010216.2 transmembrane protein, putative [Tetrahymena thermophila SB210]